MCEFCTKHGEGKKWYLNVSNYSHDLLSDIKRKKFTERFYYRVDEVYKNYFKFLKILPTHLPIVGPTVRAIIKGKFLYEHWGQVIPIEDVEKVLLLTNSIVRIPCACRITTSGRKMRTCFVTTVDPGAIGVSNLIDQSFLGGPDNSNFEEVSKEYALNFMKEQEKNGMFHSIWSFRAPFIGGICNCDSTGCIPLKMFKKNAPIFFKAEYIVEINKDRCKGCQACVKICPFGAIKYDSTDRTIKIGLKKCYGCGICRASCKSGALQLVDRTEYQQNLIGKI